MLLQCDAFVWTTTSNYCMMLDELRMMAGKENAYVADLQKSTLYRNYEYEEIKREVESLKKEVEQATIVNLQTDD